MDSGHFPAFGMYLAACWKIFGKSLAVSHLSVLPFLLGVWHFSYRLGDFFLGGRFAWLLTICVFLDPVFAGQTVLVSPDLGVMCFFLAGLWAIIKPQKLLLAVAAIALAALSMRGMMIVLALYFFKLLTHIIAFDFSPKSSPLSWLKFVWKNALPFVPAGLLSLAFLYAHYAHTGWVGYHADSPWAPAFAKVDFAGFLKNCGVLVWRILDYGRVFLLLIGAAAAFVFYRKKVKNGFPRKFLLLVSLVGVCVFCLTPSVLIHKGLLLHRYLLPLLFALNLTALYLLIKAEIKFKNALLALGFIGLATGNFWVYPKHVAQGWDATLAHLPYYDLRDEMLNYIEEKSLEKSEIGSAFPNISGFEYTDLQPRGWEPVRFDFAENDYILYSNVMNDFSDAELTELENDWKKVKEMKSGGVCFILYGH